MNHPFSKQFMAYDSKDTALAVLRYAHEKKGIEGHLKTLKSIAPVEVIYGVQFDWPENWDQLDIDDFYAEINREINAG